MENNNNSKYSQTELWILDDGCETCDPGCGIADSCLHIQDALIQNVIITDLLWEIYKTGKFFSQISCGSEGGCFQGDEYTNCSMLGSCVFEFWISEEERRDRMWKTFLEIKDIEREKRKGKEKE